MVTEFLQEGFPSIGRAVWAQVAVMNGAPYGLQLLVNFIRVGRVGNLGASILLWKSDASNGSRNGAFKNVAHRTHLRLQVNKTLFVLSSLLLAEVLLPCRYEGVVSGNLLFEGEGGSQRSGGFIRELRSEILKVKAQGRLRGAGRALIAMSSLGRRHHLIHILNLPIQELEDLVLDQLDLDEDLVFRALGQLLLSNDGKVISDELASIRATQECEEPRLSHSDWLLEPVA